MKLASLRQGGRDGTLILIDRRGRRGVVATRVAPTLQTALDNWARAAPELEELQRQLDRGNLAEAFPITLEELAAPLPRAYQWADGSAYLSHVERVRRALAMLPEEQQHVVRLSFFEDRPHPEIAVQLSVPLGTVKSRLRLALSKLRLHWEQAS